MKKLTDKQKQIINEMINQEEPGDLEAATMLALKLGSMFPDPELWNEIADMIGDYN